MRECVYLIVCPDVMTDRSPLPFSGTGPELLNLNHPLSRTHHINTGGTLTIVGLDDMGPGLRLKSVSKETLLADVQYRGAISDFTIIKNQIGKADCESLWVRYNEDDVYGDGNNFEVAVTKAAGEAFEMEDAERAVAAEAEKAAALLAAEEHKPGRKKKVKPVSKPWVSLGSELEIAAETLVTDKHPRIVVQVFRKRSHFGTEEKKKKLADVDAITLWNSASMVSISHIPRSAD